MFDEVENSASWDSLLSSSSTLCFFVSITQKQIWTYPGEIKEKEKKIFT